MAREAPSALGTSLIDLLVGALALVTLLWAASPREEPEPPNETAGALAMIDQFGITHIRGFAIHQPGHWTCKGVIDWKRARLVKHSCTTPGGGPAPKYIADDGTSLERPGARPQDPPLKVRWHAHQSRKKNYTATLMVSATGIGAEGLVLEASVLPCCAVAHPHYLRVFTRAQGAKQERYALWHERAALMDLLTKAPEPEPWIGKFTAGVRSGAIVPEIVAFDARGKDCIDWRGDTHKKATNPTTVRITFAPDASAVIEIPGEPGARDHGARPDPRRTARQVRKCRCPMTRRKSVADPIGIAMLDLVSGVLALVVVLYALAPRSQAVPSEAPMQRPVRVETSGAASKVPLGVEIVIAGRAHRNWPRCVGNTEVVWLRCDAGRVRRGGRERNTDRERRSARARAPGRRSHRNPGDRRRRGRHLHARHRRRVPRAPDRGTAVRRRLTSIVAGVLAAQTTMAAGDLERAVRALKARTKAEVLCGLNASSSSASENTLVWERPDGTLGAIVFRANTRSDTTPEHPCWTAPGHCAVFKGHIDAPAGVCNASDTSGAFDELSVPGVRTHVDPGAADAKLMAFAEHAEVLMRGMRRDEHQVGLLEGVPFYAARQSNGTRNVRITPPGALPISIKRLKMHPSELDLATLRQAAKVLRTTTFEIAGLRGALTHDGPDAPRAALDGRCVRLVPLSILRKRLKRGNRLIAGPAPPPAAGRERNKAYNQWVQALLDWDGTQTGTRQHPAIALYRERKKRTCSR